MKYIQNLLRIISIFSILILILASAACSKNENPSIDLATAIANVSSSGAELTVKSYASGEEAALLKGSPEYNTITNYLNTYTPERTQPRYVEIAGKNEEVKIPYVLNYVLTFKLSDGSELIFDYGYDKIWFTTEKMLYAGLVDLNLDGVLQQIVGD